MEVENPSNAVLAEKINSLKDIVVADRLSSSVKLNEILVQATKTNGRVDKLEKWKNMAAGMAALLITIVIPIFIALAVNYLSNQK